MKPSNRTRSRRTDRPTLPELDQTKRSVLNSLASLQSRRSYQHAIDEFIDWPIPRSPSSVWMRRFSFAVILN